MRMTMLVANASVLLRQAAAAVQEVEWMRADGRLSGGREAGQAVRPEPTEDGGGDVWSYRAALAAGGRCPQDMFTPISFGRISQAIVEQIQQAIRQGRLKPGDRLPPERELSERLGTSRVTVREALRILQANGLVQIRRGARGGAFVTVPGPDLIGERLANILMFAPVTPEEVAEARWVFELGITPLACERATEADLAELVALCDRAEGALEAGWYRPELSAGFHVRLASCTHNTVVELIVNCLREPLSLMGGHQVAGMAERGLREHKDLVAAVANRDPDRATAVMAQHLATPAQAPHVTAEQRIESVP
jgi:GntR family transcriptional repressor for pyruvate dehydrogenase complex